MNHNSNHNIPVNDDVFIKNNSHLKDKYFIEEVYKTYLKITDPKKKRY